MASIQSRTQFLHLVHHRRSHRCLSNSLSFFLFHVWHRELVLCRQRARGARAAQRRARAAGLRCAVMQWWVCSVHARQARTHADMMQVWYEYVNMYTCMYAHHLHTHEYMHAYENTLTYTQHAQTRAGAARDALLLVKVLFQHITTQIPIRTQASIACTAKCARHVQTHPHGSMSLACQPKTNQMCDDGFAHTQVLSRWNINSCVAECVRERQVSTASSQSAALSL